MKTTKRQSFFFIIIFIFLLHFNTNSSLQQQFNSKHFTFFLEFDEELFFDHNSGRSAPHNIVWPRNRLWFALIWIRFFFGSPASFSFAVDEPERAQSTKSFSFFAAPSPLYRKKNNWSSNKFFLKQISNFKFHFDIETLVRKRAIFQQFFHDFIVWFASRNIHWYFHS